MKKIVYPFVLLGCLLVMPFESALTQSGDAIVGINLGHAQTSTIEQQATLLNDLKPAGVQVIRAGIGPDDKGVDLVRRIYVQGIKILWIIPLKYPAGELRARGQLILSPTEVPASDASAASGCFPDFGKSAIKCRAGVNRLISIRRTDDLTRNGQVWFSRAA
jgi:hypothetical protein